MVVAEIILDILFCIIHTYQMINKAGDNNLQLTL